MVTIKLEGDWLLAQAMLGRTARDLKDALRAVVRQEAEDCRSMMVDGIIAQAPGGQAFKPLAASTLAFRRAVSARRAIAAGQRKIATLRENARQKEAALTGARRAGMYVSTKKFGTAYSRYQKLQASIARVRGRVSGAMTRARIGTKALIGAGDLIGGIRAIHRAEMSEIGIMRSAKTRDGKGLVSVARIHEFGAGPKAVAMTPRQRVFLHAMYRRIGMLKVSKGGGGVHIVHVPPRPFVRPVFQAMYGSSSNAGRRITDRLARLLPIGPKP